MKNGFRKLIKNEFFIILLLVITTTSNSYSFNSKSNIKGMIKEVTSFLNIKNNEKEKEISFSRNKNIKKLNYLKSKKVNQFLENQNIMLIQKQELKLHFAQFINFNSGTKNYYFKKVKITCNVHNCKPEYGKCSDDKKFCICNYGFVHAPRVFSKKHICRYNRFRWITCLILELLLPGLGILYFRSFYFGMFKIILIPTVYYHWGNSKGWNLLFISIAGYALIIFHIRDLVLIFPNDLPDRNGVFPL